MPLHLLLNFGINLIMKILIDKSLDKVYPFSIAIQCNMSKELLVLFTSLSNNLNSKLFIWMNLLKIIKMAILLQKLTQDRFLWSIYGEIIIESFNRHRISCSWLLLSEERWFILLIYHLSHISINHSRWSPLDKILLLPSILIYLLNNIKF